MTNSIPELNKDFLGINNNVSRELADNDPQSLKHAIQLLLDIEAIKRLKHAYFRCIDTANVTELSELLHEEVIIDFFGGTYEWSLTGKEAFIEAIGAAFNGSRKSFNERVKWTEDNQDLIFRWTSCIFLNH